MMDVTEILREKMTEIRNEEERFLQKWITQIFGSVSAFLEVQHLYVLEANDVHPLIDFPASFERDQYQLHVTTEYKIRRKTPGELSHERANEIIERNTRVFNNCIVCGEPILVPKDTEVKTIHGYYHGAPYECLNGRQELFTRGCEGSWDGAVGSTDPCDLCGKTYDEH